MNMIRFWVFFLIISELILFFGYGCSPSYNILTRKDEFDGYVIHRMSGNRLPSPNELIVVDNLSFNLQKYIKNDLEIYSIVLEYYGSGWIFISDGESLILLVDGERISFSGDGSSSSRSVISGGPVLVNETAYYIINSEEIKKIAFAKEIKVKLLGGNGFIERKFNLENIANIKKFYFQFVENKSTKV